MKVLVTGAQGFIGKHMVVHLSREGHEIFQYDINSTEEELVKYVKECDFIVHLAGVNRPLTVEEFYSGNTNFTKHLVDVIKENNKIVPIIMSSSVKASEDSDYGKSKLMAESFLLSSGLPVYVYRLNNVFGKWGRPNYNSASATFCYNIAHDLPISIRDRNFIVLYNYIDDICDEFIRVINSEFHLGSEKILYVSPTYECSLGRLADTLYYYQPQTHRAFRRGDRQTDRADRGRRPETHSGSRLQRDRAHPNPLRRIRPCTRRRHSAGQPPAAGRRTGHRQEHPAAADGTGHLRPTSALCQRRRERAADTHACRPHRHPCRQLLRGKRYRHPAHLRAYRCRAARPARCRLHPDRRHRGRRLARRQREPNPPVHHRVPALCQDHGRPRAAHRPYHQGRHPCRTQGHGAYRRCRPPVRRRPQLRLPHPPSPEKPFRLHLRDRQL